MKISAYILFFMALSLVSCKKKPENLMDSIIPEPQKMEVVKGYFQLNNNTSIVFDTKIPELEQMVYKFCDDIEGECEIRPGSDIDNPLQNRLRIKLDDEAGIPDEGYTLKIKKQKIDLTASSYAGVFYGLQSLKQLIYENMEGEKPPVYLPLLEIEDYPRFSWRGMHLDVCRHFMPVEDVKKYLDYMALYKFNKFHWHLTEDQGWRIEIKQYPLLTEIGAWRDETMVGHYSDEPRTYDGKRHGGFYTHEDVREIIQYASDRYIEIIPEIEMPGHAKAAIAAYPWLGVTGEKVEVMKEWGISPYIYMPSEETFGFLENVLSEVMELFPSEYIHIGGDEAIKDQWEGSKEVQQLIKDLGLDDEHELQSWFVQRIEKFLNKNGKKLIGWDEILEGGLAPNATVMSWRGNEGGIAAAKMGHDVIMSPTSHCYFDYYQAKPIEEEPLAIGGYLPLEKVYSFEPVPDTLTEKEAEYILGAQANIWTEYIPDFKQVEYMIFPRMLAMSEVTWTLPENKNAEDFNSRVKDHKKIFEILGVNYSESGMPD
jgi:hexosaminidase